MSKLTEAEKKLKEYHTYQADSFARILSQDIERLENSSKTSKIIAAYFTDLQKIKTNVPKTKENFLIILNGLGLYTAKGPRVKLSDEAQVFYDNYEKYMQVGEYIKALGGPPFPNRVYDLVVRINNMNKAKPSVVESLWENIKQFFTFKPIDFIGFQEYIAEVDKPSNIIFKKNEPQTSRFGKVVEENYDQILEIVDRLEEAEASKAGPSETPRQPKKEETDIPTAPKTGSRTISDPRLTEATNTIGFLEQRIRTATEEIKKLTEQAKKKDEDIFALQIQLATANSKVTKLESDIRKLDEQKLELTSRQKITLEENAKQVAQLREELSKLNEIIKAKDKTIAELEKLKDEYMNQVAKLKPELAQIKEKNAEYISKLSAGTSLDTSSSVNRRIAQLIDTEKKYQDLKTQMENLTVAIRSIDAQISPQKTQANALTLINQWRNKMEEYQQRIANLERQASQAPSMQERDQLIRERDMARSTITDLQNRILEIQRQGKAQQDVDSQALQKELKDANDEIKRLRPLRERILRLQQEFRLSGNPAAAFEDFINKYQNQNADLSRALQENEQFKSEIIGLRQLSQGAQEEIKRLQDQVDLLQQAKLATNSPEMQIALQGQIKKMEELQNRISQLDSENINLRDEKDRYKKLSEERQKQIEEYKEILDRHKSLTDEYKEKYKDNLGLAGDYSADIDNLVKQIQELDKQLAEKNRIISDLDRQLKYQTQRAEDYKSGLNKLVGDSNEKIAKLEARNEAQLDENDKLARQLAEEKKRVGDLRADLAKQTTAVFVNTDTIARLDAQIVAGNQVVERLTNELNASQSALRQANVTIGNRQAEIDRLTQENANLLAQIAAAPVVAAAAPAPVVPPAAPRRGAGGGGGPPGGPGAGPAVVAPAPNIFPGDNMATQSRGLDTTTISQIDEFLSDLEVAINSSIAGNEEIQWREQPLLTWGRMFGITNWATAQAWLKKKGMVDLGDITENPKQFKIFMDGQARRPNVRTGLGTQLYTIKVFPLRFQPLTSEYKQGPVVKTIANLPGRERTVTSDLGTIVIPGQSNYTLRRQGLNYVVTSAGRSQSFGSERDANYFIQTGGFGRKTYGPITERVFGTPTKNISQAIY
jgi:DNA repair exonuclease SbcCD ATPase subunit